MVTMPIAGITAMTARPVEMVSWDMARDGTWPVGTPSGEQKVIIKLIVIRLK